MEEEALLVIDGIEAGWLKLIPVLINLSRAPWNFLRLPEGSNTTHLYHFNQTSPFEISAELHKTWFQVFLEGATVETVKLFEESWIRDRLAELSLNKTPLIFIIRMFVSNDENITLN